MYLCHLLTPAQLEKKKCIKSPAYMVVLTPSDTLNETNDNTVRKISMSPQNTHFDPKNHIFSPDSVATKRLMKLH